MTTPSETPKVKGPVVGNNNKAFDWSSLKPKVVASEDAMSAENVSSVWASIEKEHGFRSLSEEQRAGLRLAVYAYFARNGTSREGDYSGTVTMYDGTVIKAHLIKKACGFEPRKFARGSMYEAYNALKESRIMEEDERFVAKAASLGVGASEAFATADFLDDCPFFTPKELKAHDTARNYGLRRAKGARGGRSLEDVVDDRVNDGLQAGVTEFESEGPVRF